MPFEPLADGAGNQAAVFRVDRLAPYAVKVIRVTATVLLRPAGLRVAEPSPGQAAFEPSSAPTRLLAATPLIQTDAPEIRRLAAELDDESAADTAKRIHAWVSEHMTYSGYRRDARGALAALESGQGDCTEYMHLFTALARAADLPARPMAGYVLGPGERPRAAALHNWAEVFVDGRWLIADPQRGWLGDGNGRYVATRVLADDLDSSWPQGAVRFWVEGGGIEVRMR